MNKALRLLPIWVALLLASAALGQTEARSGTPRREVASLGLTVSDLQRSRKFFEQVLEFSPEGEYELAGPAVERLHGLFALRARVAVLRLGSERVELTQYLAPLGRPLDPERRSNDLSFQHMALVVGDMDAAHERLRSHGVAQISSAPQRLPDWNPNAGGIEAFYFQDPDGHALELIAFPPGKGDPRWQRRDGALFLGIDHTAIGVAETERSLAFYRDVLGLSQVGQSENWGIEQEHLNGVFGSRVRITALRGSAGIGIEFLEYLSPTGGKPYPSDQRASDLVHWHVRLAVSELEELERSARGARAPWISPGSVAIQEQELGFERGLRLRDPDGHVIELVQARGPRPAENERGIER
jgi:catechol 2,3-dioxygenase-like lactoylglutathione lyase family enzyme